MMWMVIKRFLDQWKALTERKKEDHGLAPKLTKSCPVHKWLESFHFHLGKKVGVRNAPLLYVVRAVVDVPAIAPPCQAGEPHSEENESIEGNMAVRMSHTHALYKIDNGSVFDLVENAVCGSDVMSTIAPFCKTQDGCSAMNALKTQHAGKAIWDRLVKEAEHILSIKIWSGNTPTTLSQHMGTQHHAYITLTECAEHIPVDVPNDQSRVTYLIDLLKTVDPTVLAAITAIRQAKADKRVHSENAFSYLVPVCPVTAKAAKKTGKVSFGAEVSAATGNNAGGLGGGNPKPGNGSLGVDLRYHHHKEFHALSKEQKDELCEWTKANGGKKTPKGGKKPGSLRAAGDAPSAKKFKSMISELEACRTKMFEGMVEVQQLSMNAMHAGVSSAKVGSLKPVIIDAVVSNDVMIERANVAMLKLNSIPKFKDAKKGA
jgi:hypothetical protein